MSDILKISSQNSAIDSTVTKSKKKQQQEKRTECEIFEVEMLFKKTKEPTDEHFNKSSGKMILNQTENTKIVIPMKIDALSMVFTETSAISLYAILVESVCRSLRLIERSLVDQMKFSSGISVPKFYHFQPMEFAHFFTCVFPSNLKDDGEKRFLFSIFFIQNRCLVFRPIFISQKKEITSSFWTSNGSTILSSRK